MGVSVILFFAVLGFVGVVAGDEVPAHFDGSGNVTRMESTAPFLLVTGGIGLAIALLFGTARRWIPKVPAQLINMPSVKTHDYWTAPEQRPQLDRMIAEDLEWVGAATMVLIAWVAAVSGTTTGKSVGVWMLVVPTVLYTVGVVGYVVFVISSGRYRVPKA